MCCGQAENIKQELETFKQQQRAVSIPKGDKGRHAKAEKKEKKRKKEKNTPERKKASEEKEDGEEEQAMDDD